MYRLQFAYPLQRFTCSFCSFCVYWSCSISIWQLASVLLEPNLRQRAPTMPARCQPDASVVAEHRGPAVPSLKYGASLERLVRVPSAQQPLKYFTLGKRLTMLARNVSMHYRLRTSLSLRPHAVLRTSGGQRTFFTVIHQGHEGWRLTLGQNPVKLDPGLRWYLPFIHTVHVSCRTHEFDKQPSLTCLPA